MHCAVYPVIWKQSVQNRMKLYIYIYIYIYLYSYHLISLSVIKSCLFTKYNILIFFCLNLITLNANIYDYYIVFYSTIQYL